MSHELYLKSYNCQSVPEIAAVYDEWAEGYDAHMETLGWQAPQQVAALLAERFSHDRRKTVNVLDVGAGTGLVGLALHDLGFVHIDAFDVSQSMLDQAHARGVYRHTIMGNAEQLCEHIGEKYDAVICVGALNFGHIPADALQEFVLATKTGGYVAFSTRQDYFERASESMQRLLEMKGLWQLAAKKARDTSIHDRMHYHWLYERCCNM